MRKARTDIIHSHLKSLAQIFFKSCGKALRVWKCLHSKYFWTLVQNHPQMTQNKNASLRSNGQKCFDHVTLPYNYKGLWTIYLGRLKFKIRLNIVATFATFCCIFHRISEITPPLFKIPKPPLPYMPNVQNRWPQR